MVRTSPAPAQNEGKPEPRPMYNIPTGIDSWVGLPILKNKKPRLSLAGVEVAK